MIYSYKFILSLLISSVFSMHPVHISVTSININCKKEIIEISFKVFSDDFQDVINNNFDSNLNIKDSLSINKNINNITSYFNSNFKLKLNNNRTKDLTYIKFRSNYEATWFYYKISTTELNNKLSKLQITNLILTDLYPDQNNLVIIKNNNTENGFQLNKIDCNIDLSLK